MAPSATFPSNRLKIITITAAFLHIIVFVILIKNYIFSDDSVLTSVSTVDTRHIISIISAYSLMVYFVVSIVSAGFFIYKAFLNEPKCTMYDIVLLTNIAFLLLHVRSDYAGLALLELCVFCCTAALQRRYERSLLNDPATPPPTYKSCNIDALAGPSTEPDAQVNSEANAEVVSDSQVDRPKNTSETQGLNGSVK